jgi:hypothetical protein
MPRELPYVSIPLCTSSDLNKILVGLLINATRVSNNIIPPFRFSFSLPNDNDIIRMPGIQNLQVPIAVLLST